MFAVLEALPNNKRGILGHLMEILKPTAPTVTQRTLGGITFLQIKARPNWRGDWDWEWIGEGVPRGAVVLLPKSLPRPAGLPGPEMGRVEKVLLHQSVVEVLRGCHLPLYRKSVGLIDPGGDYLELGETILHHASLLRVVTENFERYRGFAGEMLERYGAPVLVGEGVESLGECLFVVSPGAYASSGGIPATCPVLAGAPQSFEGRSQVVGEWTVEMPMEILEGLPQGIDPMEFLAAAGEGSPFAGDCAWKIVGRCGKRTLTLSQIAKYLEGAK